MPAKQKSHIAPVLPLASLPLVSPGGGFDLLKDVLVVDITTSVAGPAATMMLGDLGATIVKVERPGGGDDARAWGPPFLNDESLWFLSVNRNKRSLCLDYSRVEGRALLQRVIAKSDVVVLNQPPRVAKKFGLDPDELRTLNKSLIYVSITGFGLGGEREDWACYDLIAEGYSGVMDLTGEPHTGPQKIGAPAADMLAGQDAALATVAALYRRHATGEGCVIDISLVNSMTRFLGCRVVPYLATGEVPRRTGGRDSVIAIYQTFETSDLPLTLALGSDAIWRRFWQSVGQPEVAEDAATNTNSKRRSNRERIVANIQIILRGKRRDEWLKIFQEARVPAGPINRVDEVAVDAELQRQRTIFALKEGDRIIPQVGTGFAINGKPNTPRLAPPRLGEHSCAILRDLLDCSADEIAALREAAIIQGDVCEVR